MTNISGFDTNTYTFKANLSKPEQKQENKTSSFKQDVFFKQMDNLGISPEATEQIWSSLNFMA